MPTTDRLIFARPSNTATLAPIYAALLALVAVSLLGLGIAYWAGPSQGQAAQRTSEAPPPRMRVFEGRMEVLPEPRLPRSRLKAI
jgi:hypothetical protein